MHNILPFCLTDKTTAGCILYEVELSVVAAVLCPIHQVLTVEVTLEHFTP